MTSTTPIFETHRLAVSLVEAHQRGDTEQVLAVLATVQESELGPILRALAEMVVHAQRSMPAADFPAFATAYRRVLDRAETLVGEPGPER